MITFFGAAAFFCCKLFVLLVHDLVHDANELLDGAEVGREPLGASDEETVLRRDRMTIRDGEDAQLFVVMLHERQSAMGEQE